MATSLFEGLVDPRQQEYERQQSFFKQLGSVGSPQAFKAAVGANLGQQMAGLFGPKSAEQDRTEKIQKVMGQLKGVAGTEEEKLSKLADLLDQEGLASDAFKIRQQMRDLQKSALGMEADKARIEASKAQVKSSEAQVKKIEEDIKGERFKQIAKIYEVPDPVTQLPTKKQFYETYERQADGSYKLFGVSETPNKDVPMPDAAMSQTNPFKAALDKQRAAKQAGTAQAAPMPTAPAGTSQATLPANKQDYQRQLAQASANQDGKRYKYLLAYGKTKGW